MDLRYAAAAGGIALVDLALSGDNAMVIGAVASGLPRPRRPLAIAYGGVSAVILRLMLAIGATELLQIPLLRLLGGAILLSVCLRLLLPASDVASAPKSTARFFSAVVSIVAADVAMSLDNVLAVGALAAGDVALLVGGLALSMTILFVASAYVARLIDRFNWLLGVAAVILAWTAAGLMLDDPVLWMVVRLSTAEVVVVRAGAALFVLGLGLALRRALGWTPRRVTSRGPQRELVDVRVVRGDDAPGNRAR